MAQPVALLVKLTFVAEKMAEFEAFERTAAAILSGYGGTIVLVFRPTDEPGIEWHVVTFPDAAAFTAYRQDERVAALKPQREALIINSEIIPGSLATYLTDRN